MMEPFRMPTPVDHFKGHLISKESKRVVDESIVKFKKMNLGSASHAEIVGCLTGYEFVINKARKCAGYCDFGNMIIALSKTEHPYYIPGGVKVSAKTIEKMTIFHEIAHALQAHVERFEKEAVKNLSERIKTEWEAESIAFLMINSCVKKVPARAFCSYMDVGGITFYKEWFKGSQLIDDIVLPCPQ